MSASSDPMQHEKTRPSSLPDDAWRLPHLDVLRGLAATWVVLFHMVYLTTPNMVPPALLDKFVKSGGMGVTLFFVVSAFSLCLSSDRHPNEERWIFYLRRLFRIVPLFYCMLIATLLRDRLAFGTNHSYPELIANLLFLFNFVADWQTGIVWASWTIGVEMVFYFLFPYIWQGYTSSLETFYRAAIALTLSIIAYALIYHFDGGPQFWQWSFFKHLPSFIFGMLVYSAWRSLCKNRQRVEHNEVLGRATAAAALFLGVALLYSDQEFQLIPALYWQALIFSLLALGAALGAARTFFSIPALRWAGKNSYSIYLAHPLIIVVLQPLYRSIAAKAGVGPLAFLVSAAITLFCVFATSEICWRLIEKPGIDAGSRVIKMLRLLRSNLQVDSESKKNMEISNA